MRHLLKTDITTVCTDTVTEGGICYKYTLQRHEDKHRRDFSSPIYSIRAEILTDRGTHEESEIKDAFIDPGYALLFYELCKENLVMPVHLSEVFEDFMS